MTAIQESFAKNSFTSATIITRESFNLSSSNLIFEIRAALPTTEGLSGQVLLIPEDDLKTGSINGKIFILMNLNSSIKYGYKYNQDDFNTKPFESRTNLQEFQTYRFETYPDINHTDLYWSMNGTGFSSIDGLGFLPRTTPNCMKIMEKGRFRLIFNLVVIGNRDKIIKQAGKWWCSSMIIDYIKVFKLGHNENETMAFGYQKEIKASKICYGKDMTKLSLKIQKIGGAVQ